MTDIAQWLGNIGLEEYVELFNGNAIDLEVLPEFVEANPLVFRAILKFYPSTGASYPPLAEFGLAPLDLHVRQRVIHGESNLPLPLTQK